MERLSREQAIILTVTTGALLIDPVFMKEDVERRLGRKVNAAEFNNQLFRDELQALYHEDFMKLVYIEPKIEIARA